ncbi:ribosome silencing factor [Hyphomicrobium sulfonivorans]|uniref:Ribosomal silencing factor RsfS n=1 Tax=Hyphomicrobium sulfonivorans TaxID=121290 RepID=A0A109BBP7_HYPSL|nr:ribosome silencing factor [Hyphomicrobium sulfonivorans]KWT65843.1 Iojap protein [Hyphomicrobium sulfonivorans]MBI1648798.1 ribosome silencing factor [Hyphomicrobium sulfonivorans]NSL70667.1 ribosome silencing factor [Hyphomicrobium sulfonivorans]
MRTALEGAHSGPPHADPLPDGRDAADLLKQIVFWLDEAKAENIVTIDLAGKSSIGDFMVVATGGSDRHVSAISEQLSRKLKEGGSASVRTEGRQTSDWVLVDTGDIIVHIFRQEVREFYNLEKMWSADRPEEPKTAH